MLDQIPVDIFHLILREVQDISDLKHLSLVSTLFHKYTVPELYRSITFFAFDEQNLVELGVDSFLARNTRHIKHVKELHFAACFHRNLRSRCPGHDKFFQALDSQLTPLFDLIEDDSLQKFSWNLGTCVPGAILSYIPKHQSQIRSLEITTDITCIDLRPNVYDDFRFARLQHISWRGDSLLEAKARGEILRGSAQFLKEVEIDLIDPDETEVLLRTPLNLFALRYLKLKQGEQSVWFHSLRKLTLSGVCFRYGIYEISSAFNFFQLRSLKLRNCLDTNPLLDMLAGSPQPMRLTSFELNFTSQWGEQDDLTPLVKFLRSFEGLEDLYISFPLFASPTDAYWESILHHKSTLRRVVHQEVGLSLDPRHVRLSERPIGALLERCNLNCLGVGCLLNDLPSSLAHFSPRPTFRLLHIRVTGWVSMQSIRSNVSEKADAQFSQARPDVLEFADWAFGPEGLPTLEILAYGDFSYRDRQPNILLCRSRDLKQITGSASTTSVSNTPYRPVTKKDVRLWEVIRENLDLLEACPEDYLLHPW